MPTRAIGSVGTHIGRAFGHEVLYIAQDIPCEIVLRLDNLQVVNAFNDGPLRYEYDWLRRNDKDMATLAWELDAARRAKGFGGLRAAHQLGHPEKRKKGL